MAGCAAPPLWHAATLLREHRGDGHVVANVAHGIDGLDAHLLAVATSDVERATLQPNRGWTDEEWDDARGRLEQRGWLVGDTVTERGREARRRVEALTDDLARAAWTTIGDADSARLAALLEPIARRVVDARAVPVPNPMGVPWPPR